MHNKSPPSPSRNVQVTIPENGQSFALIYSIEDPGDPRSPVGGMGVQVMGPDDGYICQHSTDVSSFWASRNALELGGSFRQRSTRRPREPVSEVGATVWMCGSAESCCYAPVIEC
jgi:tocopherol cyclase